MVHPPVGYENPNEKDEEKKKAQAARSIDEEGRGVDSGRDHQAATVLPRALDQRGTEATNGRASAVSSFSIPDSEPQDIATEKRAGLTHGANAELQPKAQEVAKKVEATAHKTDSKSGKKK